MSCTKTHWLAIAQGHFYCCNSFFIILWCSIRAVVIPMESIKRSYKISFRNYNKYCWTMCSEITKPFTPPAFSCSFNMDYFIVGTLKEIEKLDKKPTKTHFILGKYICSITFLKLQFPIVCLTRFWQRKNKLLCKILRKQGFILSVYFHI